MEQRETLAKRREMVQMHDVYRDRLNSAIISKQFIEATWFCYAIFEQRISRLIEKIIPKCPVKNHRKSNTSASITTRIQCLINLILKSNAGLTEFDVNLLTDIMDWCKARNVLVHDLIELDKYKKFDDDFEKLAKDGINLVNRLYDESTKFREWFIKADSLPDFPVDHKCRCKREQCIKLKDEAQ